MNELVANRYKLQTRLGAGGFGEVWRAVDQELGRTVAVKLLHKHLDDDARRRFGNEAKALGKLALSTSARGETAPSSAFERVASTCCSTTCHAT